MSNLRVPLSRLGCAASTRLAVEARLATLPGVLSVYLNPVSEVLFLQVDPKVFNSAAARAVIEGFGARLPVPAALGAGRTTAPPGR